MRQQESIEYAGQREDEGTRREGEPVCERERARRKRARAYGGIPSLPGHPRQLPHFPFSSRVCPMLLRFRVGSEQTEPPSASLLRTRSARYTRLRSVASLLPHTTLVPATRTILLATRDWPGGGVWWLCPRACARTTHVHVHACTHA